MLYALNDQGGNGADESPAVAPIASAIATAKASSIFLSPCPIVPPAVTLERTCVSAGCIVGIGRRLRRLVARGRGLEGMPFLSRSWRSTVSDGL